VEKPAANRLPPCHVLTLLRQNALPGRAGMNGEESPPKL
jgi:hypothetical protein